MTALYITIATFVGLVAGISIGIKGRKVRDNTIAALEQDLTIKRNVLKSLNEENVKLRKRLKKKDYDTDDRDN